VLPNHRAARPLSRAKGMGLAASTCLADDWDTVKTRASSVRWDTPRSATTSLRAALTTPPITISRGGAGTRAAARGATRGAEPHRDVRQPPGTQRRAGDGGVCHRTAPDRTVAERHGVTICVELLNSKVDHKDYQGDRTAFGAAIIEAVGSCGEAAVRHLSHADHGRRRDSHDPRARKSHRTLHTGGVPGRHELDDTQELNYRAIARAIADTGSPDSWRMNSCRRGPAGLAETGRGGMLGLGTSQ